MKLYCLAIQYKSSDGKVRSLKVAHELSSFGYFQRGSVQEFMDFTCKIVTERTSPTSRQSVKEKEYMVHAYVRSDGLAGVLLSDLEYPGRVAFTLLNKVLDDFSDQVRKEDWPTVTENTVVFAEADEYLRKYQNPREADAMTKIQADVDETKIILHNTIEAVLDRGEKLDDLVYKSEGLSAQSKAFYKTAKKTNSCCVIL